MRHKVLSSYGLLFPAVLILLLIVFIPMVWVSALSFFNYRLGQQPRFVGFKNYLTIFTDTAFIRAIIQNVIFVLFSVAIQMSIGLGIALLFARPIRFKRLWIALLLAPLVMSPSVSSAIWKYLFDYNIGPFNYFLQMLGLPRLLWFASEKMALPTVILVNIWQAIPNVFLMLYPARISIDSTYYEAGLIDGATGFDAFRYITMPLLKQVFLMCLVFRTIFAFRTFGDVWNLTGGGPMGATEILAVYLYRQGFVYWKFGIASAVAVIILIFTFIISGYQIGRMQSSFITKK